jgi:predicted ATPase
VPAAQLAQDPGQIREVLYVDARSVTVKGRKEAGGGLRRYILTGTPGAGKTAILLELEARGYAVVPEAATDVIARRQARGEPWHGPAFLDAVVDTQRRRQEAPVAVGITLQVYDRSPICTLGLARYVGQPVSLVLAAEVDRVLRAGVYERRVFFVRPIGFVTATAARRITYEQSLEFERVHEEAYRASGFELVDVPPAAVPERATMIDRLIRRAG